MGWVATLRQRHSLMLQRASSKDLPDLPKHEILGFLDEVVASGRSIASEQGREAAEGILDYWVGRLLAQDRSSYRILASYGLDDYAGGDEESGDPDDPENEARHLEALKAKAKGITETSDAGRSLRVTLLELFRLQPESRKPEVSALPKRSEAMQDSGVQKTVGQLLELGLILELGEGESAGYVLAREELLQEWPVLHKLVSERIALRELANGWNKGGRKKNLLLRDPAQLAAAGSYPDQTKTEAAFIRESRDRLDQAAKTRRNLGILGSVVAAALVIMLVVWGQHSLSVGERLREQLGEVEKLKGRMREQDMRYDRLERTSKRASAELDEAKYDLDRTKDRALLNAWSSNLRLREADAAREKIGEISRALMEVPDLPPGVSGLLPPPQSSNTEAPPPFAALAGAIVEFYVPDPADVGKAGVFLAALQVKGAANPWKEPLLRKGPPPVTEIRYYFDEDRLLADEIARAIKADGFDKALTIKYSTNELVPKRFIIVSFAAGAAQARNDAPKIWVRRIERGETLELPLAGEKVWEWDSDGQARLKDPMAWLAGEDLGVAEAGIYPWEAGDKEEEGDTMEEAEPKQWKEAPMIRLEFHEWKERKAPAMGSSR